MGSIAAVVVTYNRCELLAQCVARLLDQGVPEGWELSVLVVDNASTDDTAYVLAPAIESGEVLYYNTGANLGGAGGFAFGMKQAVEAGFDYLWVLDDDCLVQPGALEALLAADEKLAGNWGFLSSVAYWKDGSICAMNVQRHPLFSNITDFSAELQPATLASFVSLFVSAVTVREVGLPRAEFFIWTDDWDFTRRISRLHPCYVVGTSRVLHASDTNNPGNIYTDPPERLGRYRYVYRNDGVLYRAEGVRGVAYLFARALYHTVRVLFGGVGAKGERISLIWKGTVAGLKFDPKLEFPA